MRVADVRRRRKLLTRSAWRRVVVIVGIAALVVVGFLVGMTVWNRTRSAPSFSLLKPLPASAHVLLNKSVPGGGSEERNDRIAVIEFQEITNPDEAIGLMVDRLGQRGWKITGKSGIEPKSGACVDFDTAGAFLADPSRNPEEKRAVTTTVRGAGPAIVVVSLLYC